MSINTSRTPVPGPVYTAAFRLLVRVGSDGDCETVLAWCRKRYGQHSPTDFETAVQWVIGIAAQNGYTREVLG